jgi:hypothetical protein
MPEDEWANRRESVNVTVVMAPDAQEAHRAVVELSKKVDGQSFGGHTVRVEPTGEMSKQVAGWEPEDIEPESDENEE